MREIVADPEYLELTNRVLIGLNEMIQVIAEREGKTPDELFPTFPAWAMKETRLVKWDLAAKKVWVELRKFPDYAGTKALVIRQLEPTKEELYPTEILQADGTWRKIQGADLLRDTDKINVNP